MGSSSDDLNSKKVSSSHQPFTSPTKMGLYDDLEGAHHHASSFSASLTSKLGITMPNPAPEIDMAAPPALPPTAMHPPVGLDTSFEDPDEPRKKKYAKEAWPGKKPVQSLLV